MTGGKRYTLTVPRGSTPVLDALSGAAEHTITVYGEADLQRRLDEAATAGVTVRWYELGTGEQS